MKKRVLSLLLALVMVLGLLPAGMLTAQAAEGDISTLAELEAFRDAVNGGDNYAGKTVTLTADIDLGGSEENQWTPIGISGKAFKGTFDGGGHRITGLYVNGTDSDQGLFGYIGEGGTVQNLGVAGTVIGSSDSIGGVVGFNQKGTVENCYNTCTVTGSDQKVGGVVGYNSNGTVTSCYNAGDISGTGESGKNVGGIIGENAGSSSLVENCYNEGKVSSDSYSVGGVIGLIQMNGTAKKCYNFGAVTGSSSVGGVVGTTYSGSTATDSYYLESTAEKGVGSSSGKDSAVSKTAAEFAVKNTFSGWDFDGVWRMSKGLGRPILINNPEPEPHSHPICGAECPGHDGTHEAVEWKALTSDSDGNLYIDGVQLAPTAISDTPCYTLPDGSYYLADNVTPAHIFYQDGCKVNLCLNGKTLDMGTNNIDGGTLTLCDCGAGGTVTGDHYGSKIGDGLIRATGSLSMYGGRVINTTEKLCPAIGIFTGTASIFGGEVISQHHSAISVDSNGGSVVLSGGPVIRGTEDQPDIHLHNEWSISATLLITLAGPLTATTPYRVKSYKPVVFTKDWSTHMPDKDFSDCFVSAAEGKFIEQDESGELKFSDLAITGQPTAENDYTVTANGDPASYAWYPAADVAVTEENATPCTGSHYISGRGWMGANSGWGLEYFKLNLSKGDTVAVTPQGTLGDHDEFVLDSDSAHDYSDTPNADGAYVLTAEADGEYTLSLRSMESVRPMSSMITAVLPGHISGGAVAGQTTKQFTGSSSGTYLCKVSYANGTVLTSNVVAYTPSHTHTMQTGNSWTYDAANHWHQCTAEDCPDVDGSKADTAAHTKGYDKDVTQHWEKCSVCGWTGTKTAHSGGTASCTAKAVCSVCGQSYGEPAGHNWGKWTFQTDGATVKRVCATDASHTESKDLSVTLDKTSYGYSGAENKPSVTVKAGDAALTLGTDYTVSYQNNVNKGTATVTVTGKGGYAGSVEKTFAITAKSLTATAATATSRAYDGTASVAVTAVALEGVVDGDDVAVDTADLKGTVSSPNVSEEPYETVTLQGLTLTGDKAANYTLDQVNVTLPASVTISKATAPAATPGSFNIANSLEKTYNYLLSLLCPQLNQPSVTENRKDWGERSYSIESVEFTQDGYYTEDTAYIDRAEENAQYVNRLYLPILFNAATHTGQVGTVTVKISSTNYEDFTNTVKIIASNKTAVTFEGIAAPDKVYDGRPYAYEGTLAVKTGNVYVTDADVEIVYAGRGSTGYSERETPPTNAGEFAMIVRIADADEDYIGRRSYNFTIRKANGEGSVTLANYAHGGIVGVPVPVSATNGVDGVSYAYKVKGAPDETYTAAKPTAAGEYTVRATFPATLNYTGATATADFTISHAYAAEWSSDEAGHYHLCPCGDKGEVTAHVYDNDQDKTCNTCGYQRTVTPSVPGAVIVTPDNPVAIPGGGTVSKDPDTGNVTITPPADTPSGTTTTIIPGGNGDVTVDPSSGVVTVPGGSTVTIPDGEGGKTEITVPDDEDEATITPAGDGKLDIPTGSTVTTKDGVSVTVDEGAATVAPDGTVALPGGGTVTVTTPDGRSETVEVPAGGKVDPDDYQARPQPAPSYSDPAPNTYKPTLQQPEHGKITVSPKAPEKGDKVTVTVVPEDGYELDTITVTDKNGKSVEVTRNADGTYSYIQPRGRVTISVAMKEVETVCPRDGACPVTRFTDTDTAEWYHDGVHYCVENGLMQGTSETTFAPSLTTSRVMIATILWRLSGSPKAKTGVSIPDCEANSWYSAAVAWASEMGVVKGYGSGNFGPNDPITREQMAVMLWRYAQSKDLDVSVGEDTNILSYKDFAEISEWAVEALQWAAGSGVMNGKDGGGLDPQGLASRAEVATMLMRYCELEK